MPNRHPIQNNILMLVTSVTLHREPIFMEAPMAREAIETLYSAKHRRPFSLHAFVIMPDHVHFLVRIPAPYTISRIMNVFKSGLVFNTGLHRMWQKGFHIQKVTNGRAVIEYIHRNPVHAGLVESPERYPWSSLNPQWNIDPL